MFELFLEDCDLLEAVEMNMILNESYIEESVKIDKDRLNDMKYVKSIIKEINNSKDKKRTTSNVLLIIGVISMMTIVLIPASILLFVIAEFIAKNADKVELKDLEKTNKTIQKSIKSLNIQYESSIDKNEKKELKNSINKLEKASKEIEIAIDKIKNPLKYKKENKDAVKSLNICISKLKELLLKSKYSDLKDALVIDPKMNGVDLYNEFIWGEDDYLDIADYDVDKLNKLIESGKYADWDDIFELMQKLFDDINKSLDGKYRIDFAEDSGVDRGGFAIMAKSWR